MTKNQLQLMEVREGARHNLATESETNRSNLVKEAETERNNRAVLGETQRSNLAREAETNRANLARENESHRSNVLNESIAARNAESNRMNAVANARNASTNESRVENQNWIDTRRTNLQSRETTVKVKNMKEDTKGKKLDNEIRGKTKRAEITNRRIVPIKNVVDTIGNVIGHGMKISTMW